MNKYESSKNTPETSCIYVLYNEQHYTIKTEPLAEHHTRSCWWTPANQKEITLTLHGARLRCTTGSWMFHNVAQLRTGPDLASGSGFNMFTSRHHTILRAKQLRRELRLRFFKPPFLEHWAPRRSKQIGNKPTMVSELWEQTWARIAWCEAMQFLMQGRVQNCLSLT